MEGVCRTIKKNEKTNKKKNVTYSNQYTPAILFISIPFSNSSLVTDLPQFLHGALMHEEINYSGVSIGALYFQ